jgi:hypothetical protein
MAGAQGDKGYSKRWVCAGRYNTQWDVEYADCQFAKVLRDFVDHRHCLSKPSFLTLLLGYVYGEKGSYPAKHRALFGVLNHIILYHCCWLIS